MKTSASKHLRLRRAAFTMIEILVGTTILVILIVMLSQMVSHVGGIWILGHAQVERSEGARAVLESITKELQAVQLPIDRATAASLQFVVNPSSIGASYRNRDVVFWQAPLATDRARGDLAEIGYFVQWDETTKPENPRARLCRFFVNPTDVHYTIYSAPTSWISDDVIKAVAPADAANAYQGLFVENVIGFWVTCLDSTGSEISSGLNAFDSRVGTPALPAAVDLSFVLLDSNSAGRVTRTLQKAIQDLAGSSKDAAAFVTSVQSGTDAVFRPIVPGLRPYRTRVFLQNSK